MRFIRTASGWLAPTRVYTFEFTETGDNRRQGFVTLGPDRPPHVELEAYRDVSGWH
jgi:hypothetical protein